MRFAYVRHGEPQKGESDPELTSFGRRQATRSATWLADQGLAPTCIIHTATNRTRQTAAEIASVHGAASVRETSLPMEALGDIMDLIDALTTDGCVQVILVGHHPGIASLLATFGPAPAAVTARSHAVTLLLEGGGNSWSIRDAWRGGTG
jgi:phosphohistidine phosphatase SixA